MSLSRDSVIRTPLFIDGAERWTDDTLSVVDPAVPGEPVGEAAAATRADVSDAVAAAARAFPAWSAMSPSQRAAALRDAAARSDEEWEEDARILCRENGKILAECRRDTSMLARRVPQTAGLADQVGARRVLPADEDHVTETEVGYQPLGVVTIIVPFNWPVGILSSALPYALLAGNTVVIKPPPSAPLAVTRVASRFASKLPQGVVNVVTGRDADMAALIDSPDVQKVCFTGSVNAGRHIMRLAASSLTRVTLELGGNDPALILEDAPLDEVHLDRLFGAVFSSAGQICMNAKRLYVHRSRVRELVEGLSTRLAATILGHGLDPETTMGPLHSPAQRAFVAELVDEARAEGAEVREFGVLPAGELAEGNFLRPALVVDADPRSRIVTEEQFGPAIPIVVIDSEEDAVRLANDSWAGLSASIWTRDPDRARVLARRLVCGYVWINDHGAPRLDLRAPFGGMKQSGMGREQGIEGVRAFQDTRAVATLAEQTTG